MPSQFAHEWKDAAYEKGETQSFYNDFFGIFGVRRRSVARYEERVRKLDNQSGFIDLFWPGVLLVEQKSAGRDLAKAYGQAGEYFDVLAEKDRPRYILVSDFQNFELHDLDEREETAFTLADLSAHVEKFGFILGVQRRTFRDQDPVNVKASELVGRLHDALKASGYDGHDLEVFLVRTVFCLFADDTGIFEPRDIFLDLLETRTREDGSDLGGWLARLFQVLNTPVERRQAKLDEDLARFPYVNGNLFAARLTIPDFDAEMRAVLLDACRFDWTAISPAIFGALFQSVLESAERRAQGAHYTTEKNILKVIEPLFLDDLRAEFERLKRRKDHRRRTALEAFHKRLGKMKFFDPACGCGNFLIIAYRELRELEIELIRELHRDGAEETQRVLDTADLSRINVDQFYGIEIGEFPARIAETALWMMDHIMNNRLSLEFGQSHVRIPLEDAPHILNGDALEVDWADFLPPEDCSFVFGNPPFVGAKFQSEKQRAQVRRIAALGKSGGTLDYVTAWFIEAGKYVQKGAARIGFVATNSITQGEQVAQLWPLLFELCGLEVAFAHCTFAWGSDARGKAHVHVVIIGLDIRDRQRAEKRLFSYPDINGEPEETRHAALSPYLFDAGGLADPHLTVREESGPINGMPKLVTGTQPIDNGHYIFNTEERPAFMRRGNSMPAREVARHPHPRRMTAEPFPQPGGPCRQFDALGHLVRRSPKTLSPADAPSRIVASLAIVGTEMKRIAPSPTGSVLERRMSRRLVPSGWAMMSAQVSAAASETRSMASRIRLIIATSTGPVAWPFLALRAVRSSLTRLVCGCPDERQRLCGERGGLFLHPARLAGGAAQCASDCRRGTGIVHSHRLVDERDGRGRRP